MSTWVFSDIHGNRKLFDQIMATIDRDDRAYFLGDAIDRGPDGWAIFKEIMDDPRITFICGNHEDMMIDALRVFPRVPWTHATETWSWNGNQPTLEAIFNDDPEVVRSYLDRAQNLPIFETYTNQFGDIFWLSHAGCDYTDDLTELSREDLIWDRSHFLTNMWYHDSPDNLYIVHGHTPIPILQEEMSMYCDNIPRDAEIEPGAYYYAEGHKICIDCGAHFTDTTVLLNLDTFEEKVFTIDERETN